MFHKGLRVWEARFVVFYEGLRLWEAHLYVFYVSGRLSGGRMSNHAVSAGGSAKETLSCVGGSGLGSYEDLMNVSKILALGGSTCRVLRGSEALGGLDSYGAVALGGSAKEGPHVRGGSELGSYEDLMNV